MRKPNENGCYQCSRCKGWRFPSEFYTNPYAKSGLQSWCKSCMRRNQSRRNEAVRTKRFLEQEAIAEQLRLEAIARMSIDERAEFFRREAQVGAPVQPEQFRSDEMMADQWPVGGLGPPKPRKTVEPEETEEERYARLHPPPFDPDDPLRALMHEEQA